MPNQVITKMVNLTHVAQMAFNQPLLATAELADMVTNFLQAKITGNLNQTMIAAGDTQVMPLGDPEHNNHIAVIPVHGILVPRAGTISNACEEVMSYELLQSQITQALNNDSINEIVLDINSGGGTAQAAFECAEFIHQAQQRKPIRAIVNFNAYSGAYLIASACTEIIVSTTSGVGSIGVYQKRTDLTQWYQENGIKINTFFRGDRKVDFHPDMEMSEQEQQAINTHMDKTYQMFVDAVAKYRGLTQQQVVNTQADCFEGEQAIAIGLADTLATPQSAINAIAQKIIASQPPKIAPGITIQAAHMRMKSQL